MEIKQTIRVCIETRYRVLRLTAKVFQVAAWVLLAAGVVFSGWLAGQVLIAIVDSTSSLLEKAASFGLFLLRFSLGIGASVVPFCLVHSIGDLINLQIATEENTRYTAYLLQTRIKPASLPYDTIAVSNPPGLDQHKADHK